MSYEAQQQTNAAVRRWLAEKGAERLERVLSVFDGKERCPRCDGDGYTIEEDHDEDGYRAWQVGCSLCAGQGWVIREPCLVCGAPITMGADTIEEHDAGCAVAEQEVQA